MSEVASYRQGDPVGRCIIRGPLGDTCHDNVTRDECRALAQGGRFEFEPGRSCADRKKASRRTSSEAHSTPLPPLGVGPRWIRNTPT